MLYKEQYLFIRMFGKLLCSSLLNDFELFLSDYFFFLLFIHDWLLLLFSQSQMKLFWLILKQRCKNKILKANVVRTIEKEL